MLFHFLLEGETPEGGGATQWIIYGILLLLIVAFFVWTTVSSKKRQKQEQEKVAGLRIGDKVKTIGGVCGVVIDINDEENTFTLETGSGDNVSYVKFDKGAIYQTAPANGAAEPQPAADVSAEKSPEEPFEEAKPAEAADPANDSGEETDK